MANKKHPLQDNPTFPEKDSAENDLYMTNPTHFELLDVILNESCKYGDPNDSLIDLVPRFNIHTGDIEPGLPYIIKNVKTNISFIATLRSSSLDELDFITWKGPLTIHAKDYYHDKEWKIYPAK